MRDALPARPKMYESTIVNLDSSLADGTHWVCYKKVGDRVFYFDSFGNLKLPQERVQYFGVCNVYCNNYEREQSFDSVVCVGVS